MHRRELFRLLTAGALVPALSPDLFALFRQAQPPPGYALRTFSPHQNDTVVQMIDIILPATDTPGAKGVRVNEFMDLILTEWATPAERESFLTGLTQVDSKSNALFGKSFLDASPEQQTTLIQALDDSIDWGHRPGQGLFVDGPAPRDTHLQGEFFRVFKTMTIHGYYTSEIGFTQELKLQIIPGVFDGCSTLPAEKKA